MDDVRMVVMDDDAAVAAVAVSMVEALGGQGRVVSRVTDLLKTVDSWRPSHIAVDLAMPNEDGVEVMNLLARRRCRARIIVYSGLGGSIVDAAMRAAASNGLDVAGALLKPFAKRELQALLDVPTTPAGRSPAGASTGAALYAPTEADLRRAIQKGELVPVFMPTVDFITGELVGIEVSARWQHPQAGLLTADRFIPLAEREGLIDGLTETVAQQALAWLGRQFPGGALGLTLKLSAASLNSLSLVETLDKMCTQHGIDTRRVSLQVSEATAMSDTVAALELLTRLRLKGFDLSLGNFGVGYISLIHLVRLPISELKIDPALFNTIGNTREGRAVIKCIVDLGGGLDLRVTASGIDSVEVLQFFSQIGCHYAMGFFIGRPMDAAALDRWIAHWRSGSSSRARWEELLGETLQAEA
ncbi:MAG: response regulator [Nevskia sp.]|nr:response regulator [Nevskia sp.]